MLYKKILVLYFSGTGNTCFVAKRLCHHFQMQGSDVEYVPIEDFLYGRRNIDYSSYDLIGLGFPVHAMDAPKIVYDFLAKMPGGRFSYFLFKTAGDPLFDGGSFSYVMREMGKLGGKCVGNSLFIMPPNVGFNRSNEAIKDLCLIADRQAERVALQILTAKLSSQLDKCFYPLLKVFSHLEAHGARFFSNRWKISLACIHCGKCIKLCPQRNIAGSGKQIQFGKSCILCLRCVFNCSVHAIGCYSLVNKLIAKPYNLDSIFTDSRLRGGYFKNSNTGLDHRYRIWFLQNDLI